MSSSAFCPTCATLSTPPPPQKAPLRRRPPPRPRPSPPDPHLFSLAREATKLNSARKTLRKKLKGLEPPLADAISLAQTNDASLSTNPAQWKKVFDARNQLTVKWLWLVAAVARQAYRTYLQNFPEMKAALSLADITQEGVCGLMKGVETWDPEREFGFDAYAFYCIRFSILRAIENQSRIIRLPVHVLNKLARMRKIKRRLEEQGSGEDVGVEEVAKLAGVERGEAELYLNRSRALFSYDAPVKNGATTLREFLVDWKVDVKRHVERECTREKVGELVQGADLEELEKSVVLLKYGLTDGVERMRAEVSRILKVRVEKVRRAELSALKKLREEVGDDVTAWTALMNQ